MAKRIGIFGGTFNPIHTGHLILAERAREERNLDLVLFMPAYRPPHKANGRNIAGSDARVDMIAASVQDHPGFEVTTVEIDREGLSYTVDSLEEIAERYSEATLTLLMGSDNARDFSTWKRPDRILELADVAVWERPGSYFWPEVYPDHIAHRISSPLIEISSTDIRNRVARGNSIRYLVPEPAREIIVSRELYLP